MCTGAEKIQDAELEVMKALWSLPQPAPLSELRRILSARCGWEDSTVKTLLRRLCEKGAVEAEKREVFYYRPILTRQEYQAWSTSSLIDKVYRGSAKDLVAALVERSQLSAQDLEDLRSILYPEEESHG